MNFCWTKTGYKYNFFLKTWKLANLIVKIKVFLSHLYLTTPWSLKCPLKPRERQKSLKITPTAANNGETVRQRQMMHKSRKIRLKKFENIAEMTLGSKMTPSPSNKENIELNKNEIIQSMQCKMLNYSKTDKRPQVVKTVLYSIHVAY